MQSLLQTAGVWSRVLDEFSRVCVQGVILLVTGVSHILGRLVKTSLLCGQHYTVKCLMLKSHNGKETFEILLDPDCAQDPNQTLNEQI